MDRLRQAERDIEQAPGLERLAEIRSLVHDTMTSDASKKHGGLETVNRLHDAFIRRTLAIAEERVRASGTGAPPVSSFAVVLFGSGGRKEQTPWSDQDNGILFEPRADAPAEEAERYMGELGEAFRASLEKIGYPPCDGNVLMSNPHWRKPLSEWRRTMEGWFKDPVFESVRHMLILADARPIYGNKELADTLRCELLDRIAARNVSILPRMVQNTLRYKVLVGWLGNLLTEPYGQHTGGVDIKYGAYLPMVNAIRLLSLHRHIDATSTVERIRRLAADGCLAEQRAKDWEEAFRSVIKFRAMSQHQWEDGTYSTSGILPGRLLTKEVKRELKAALRIGADMQRAVKRKFGTGGR